jgi:two-component system response regulator AtoC
MTRGGWALADSPVLAQWVYTRRRRAVRLRVLSITNGGKTTRVELADGQELTVGRTADCDIVIDDRMVSRRHATLRGRGTLEVEDHGSHNGTVVFLNSAGHGETLSAPSRYLRLDANVPVAVDAESVIQIGAALITVELSGQRRAGTKTDAVVVDPAMARLYELGKRVARSDLTVLLLGESGVGKDVLARFIHKQSARGARELLSLNCGAVPEHLLEAELFGYVKGAFTGATKTTPGLLESADKSTVFLDEVGELSPAFQVKLLRVLETGQLMPVGGRESIVIDVRYIAATNRDLAAEIAAGRFREDLYYRLNGITLTIPPLRERPDEILSLAERFLTQEGRQRGVTFELSPEVAARLESYDWPGNVRQLRAVIRRAAVLCPDQVIMTEHIQLSERAPQVDQRPASERASAPAFEAPTPTERPTYPVLRSTPEDLREQAEELERQRILDALEAVGGNQTRAAERLGITRRALVVRLDKYGITRPRKGR